MVVRTPSPAFRSSAGEPEGLTWSRLFLVLEKGARLSCPHCRRPGIVRGHRLGIRARCRFCGLWTRLDSGMWTGSTELLFLISKPLALAGALGLQGLLPGEGLWLRALLASTVAPLFVLLAWPHARVLYLAMVYETLTPAERSEALRRPRDRPAMRSARRLRD